MLKYKNSIHDFPSQIKRSSKLQSTYAKGSSNYSAYQARANAKKRASRLNPYDWNRLPDNLKSPYIWEAFRVLHSEWVRLADTTDNGEIRINLRQQCYSKSTVISALKLLVTLNLVEYKKRGGGGRGSSYAIKWSKRYNTLTERQCAINHQKRQNWKCDLHHIRGRASNIFESDISEFLNVEFLNVEKVKPSLSIKKDKMINHPLIRRKYRHSFKKPQNLQLVRKNSRPFRWTMASIRPPAKSTFIAKHDQNAAIQAFGITISKAIEKYKLTPGQRWGKFTECIIELIENTDELELKAAQNDYEFLVIEQQELQNRKLTEKERCALILPDFCRWAGYVVKEALSISSSHRRSVQDYLAVMSPKGETVSVGQGS